MKYPTDQFLVEPHAHALGQIKANDGEIVEFCPTAENYGWSSKSRHCNVLIGYHKTSLVKAWTRETVSCPL